VVVDGGGVLGSCRADADFVVVVDVRRLLPFCCCCCFLRCINLIFKVTPDSFLTLLVFLLLLLSFLLALDGTDGASEEEPLLDGARSLLDFLLGMAVPGFHIFAIFLEC
jgi:hypothetical protein